MMFEHLPTEQLTTQDKFYLRLGRGVESRYEETNDGDIEAMLADGCLVFRVGDGSGLLMCHVGERNYERRLLIDSVYCSGLWLPGVVKTLHRLATDWQCDMIETTVANPRLARAILLCGANIEAVVLTMKVGGGREDEEHD